SNRQVLGGPGEVPEMVVPVNTPIHVHLTSSDVVHSFYIPRALFKRQAIPGSPTDFDLNFNQMGEYPGQCVQFCGLSHTDMLFSVRVVSQNDYEQWLKQPQQNSSGQ